MDWRLHPPSYEALRENKCQEAQEKSGKISIGKFNYIDIKKIPDYKAAIKNALCTHVHSALNSCGCNSV